MNVRHDTPDRPHALREEGWTVQSVQSVAASDEWAEGTADCPVCGRPVALAGAHVGIQLLRVAEPQATEGDGEERVTAKRGVEYCRVAVCSRACATRWLDAFESAGE